MPLPPRPSSRLLDGLYAAKDLSLGGGGESLGSLRLRLNKLHLLEWATT